MARIRKSLIAGGGAFVSALVAATLRAQGNPGWAGLGTAVLAGVAVGWTTYRVPNAAA